MPPSTTGKILNGIILTSAVASFVEEYNRDSTPKKAAGRGRKNNHATPANTSGEIAPSRPLSGRQRRVEEYRTQWKLDNGYLLVAEGEEPVFNTGNSETDETHWCIYHGLIDPPMPPEPPTLWERMKGWFRR